MIHNSSSDPVLIKKISLKIWSLRDEIESRIQAKIDAGELLPESMEEKIKELRDEYTKKMALPDNVVQLKSGDDLPADGEDEMAKAMAAAMENPEGEEASAEEGTDNVVSMNGESPAPASTVDGNVITIGIEAPVNLSDEKISKGKTILSEISMDKMFFFSNKAFTEGQSIVIQFCIPKTFIINADVIYCRPFNIKSRIISQNNYTHRMLVKFNFLKEGERALLRQFIQSIEPDVSKVVKKAAAVEEDGGDGDFNDLDDLGL
ncbi:hypothetical protein DOM21_06125 [Bacteriovorax stolpii]|uniref:Uncharacterized protein n=1 Tax=Bacteriovorax stolpii TaxID=960 RepID=A0A2K9NTW3_BACTC|nr:hypothetical protein [Bacteriovorax stolpii]AUN98966.1 hypothetical protein C0V70_12815 [Bacteriovorax stolpii]QDK41038.1 hypothetical protein DOM21_06125 [Bacteriovorax stolpii]TDP55511.1 hypothetical protein C8D79_0561 [Bacteriovorax stolpii]